MDYRKTVEHLREKAEIFKKSNYAVDGIVKCFEESADTIEQLVEELKQFKDKQEKGLLIELPCKVGDTVYLTHHFMVESRKKPIKCTVNEFLIEGSGHCHAVLDGTEAFYAMQRFRAVRLEEFGKTVFLTLSEAEEALAKMGGK